MENPLRGTEPAAVGRLHLPLGDGQIGRAHGLGHTGGAEHGQGEHHIDGLVHPGDVDPQRHPKDLGDAEVHDEQQHNKGRPLDDLHVEAHQPPDDPIPAQLAPSEEQAEGQREDQRTAQHAHREGQEGQQHGEALEKRLERKNLHKLSTFLQVSCFYRSSGIKKSGRATFFDHTVPQQYAYL